MCHGLHVPVISQQHDVVRIQTDRSMILGLVEQILRYVDNQQIAMMRDFCEYVCHECVDGVHGVVENQQRWLFSVENLVIRCLKTFVEAHIRSVALEHQLIFSITVQDAFDRRFKEQIVANGVEHVQYESSLARLCCPTDEKR